MAPIPPRKGEVIVNAEFWRERRVLVTGHTGFKGAWLCLWLQLMGATVTGYALAPATHPNLFTAARGGRGMRSVQGDVRALDVDSDAAVRIAQRMLDQA